MANNVSGERLGELYDLSDAILRDLQDKTASPAEAVEVIAFMVTGLWHSQLKEEDFSWIDLMTIISARITQRHIELSAAIERGDVRYEILGPKRAQ